MLPRPQGRLIRKSFAGRSTPPFIGGKPPPAKKISPREEARGCGLEGFEDLIPVPLTPVSVSRVRHRCRSPASADARDPVMAWSRQVKAADWAAPADVKRDVRSASILKDGRVVFNVAGNKYRIVVRINYAYRVVYVRFIGAHRQYDAIDAQTI